MSTMPFITLTRTTTTTTAITFSIVQSFEISDTGLLTLLLLSPKTREMHSFYKSRPFSDIETM